MTSRREIMLAGALLCFVGCQLAASTTIPSPYSHDEQAAAIVRIAPMGTDRAEVVRRLENAGIEGQFGISPSIYYCNVWKREVGQHWHLDVALLFDEDGRFYGTRRGSTAFADSSAAGSSASNQPPQIERGGTVDRQEVPRPPIRSGPRTPFDAEK